MKVNKLLILAGIGFLIVQSCKHYHDLPEPDSTPKDFTGIPCDPDSVYFKNDILPLLKSSCAYSGCHDAISQEGDVILDSYSEVIRTGKVKAGNPNDSKIVKVTLITDPNDVMPPPPNSKLSTKQINMLKKWINQGARNNGCDDCDTTTVTYGIQVTQLLDKNCHNCHNTNNASGGVELDKYTAVKAQVDNGKLWGSVNHSSGFKAMPPTGKLSACDITIIDKWIADGAPNN